MKNYTLIGYQRCGTTWLSLHFKTYYGKPNFLGEYFSQETNFDNKISFLENERKQNNEYFIKWIIWQIKECEDWWNNFYKNFEKIKILNRNAWRIFLSESYLRYNNYKSDPNLWQHKDYNMKKFSVDIEWIKQFANQYNQYIMFSNYDTIFDVDKITDEYVSNYLGNSNIKYERFVHNYEDYLQQDLDLTKEIFISELKKFGITCLQSGKIEL